MGPSVGGPMRRRPQFANKNAIPNSQGAAYSGPDTCKKTWGACLYGKPPSVVSVRRTYAEPRKKPTGALSSYNPCPCRDSG